MPLFCRTFSTVAQGEMPAAPSPLYLEHISHGRQRSMVLSTHPP